MDYSEYWSYYHDDLISQFGQHLAVVLVATLLGAIIGTTAGIAVYRAPRASEVVLKACGVFLTVPSLALYVLLLGVLGLGWPPVLTALTLYSLLPIVQNTIVGLRGVDATTVEAAAGIGMGRGWRLARVEFPMAWPVILAGIRVGALLLVSTAAIGAIVRGPGLGNAIYNGLNRIGTPSALYSALTGMAGVVIVGLLLNGAFFVLAKLTISRGLRD
ncbi:ABC transporter permease [Amycolatopsis sp. H20-H5]|uniref:ABC transporter permease n=1 Tax=Amycolatopsis sp. H20-H5 TaxID=3046309 RepID=UPI002DBD8AB3|nr:ABC transporter permease [Amycolatopsis sp. H20-H5]MEC3979056.1 ABC transporter permease [Amycolatopsis sp. H20-H5]